MDTNATATLYLPDGDAWKRLECAAFWPKVARLAASKTVVDSRRPAAIFLPLADNPSLTGVEITNGCYILRGACSAEIGEEFPLKSLIANHHAQRVTAASLFDFGSADMRHWELEVEG